MNNVLWVLSPNGNLIKVTKPYDYSKEIQKGVGLK